MIGYVYLTTNLINRMYVGKHIASKYDEKYYGSGKLIKQAIKKYGIKNFSNEILSQADTVEDLNEQEKYYINLYRDIYGRKLYNIALGGDGGDTISNKSKKEKEEFINKMTKINKERCNTKKFKDRMSEVSSNRYKNPFERERQSKKIRKAWNNEKIKKEQSERLKKYYKSNPKDNSYLNKECILEFGNTYKEFKSIKSLKKFLKDEYNFSPSNPRIKELLNNGDHGICYKSYKSKFKKLDGLLIYHKENKTK